MYDPELTGFLHLSLRLAEDPKTLERDGLYIRARLSNVVEHLEKLPSEDPRLSPLLTQLRELDQRQQRMPAIEVQMSLLRLLQAPLQSPG